MDRSTEIDAYDGSWHSGAIFWRSFLARKFEKKVARKSDGGDRRRRRRCDQPGGPSRARPVGRRLAGTIHHAASVLGWPEHQRLTANALLRQLEVGQGLAELGATALRWAALGAGTGADILDELTDALFQPCMLDLPRCVFRTSYVDAASLVYRPPAALYATCRPSTAARPEVAILAATALRTIVLHLPPVLASSLLVQLPDSDLACMPASAHANAFGPVA